MTKNIALVAAAMLALASLAACHTTGGTGRPLPGGPGCVGKSCGVYPPIPGCVGKSCGQHK